MPGNRNALARPQPECLPPRFRVVSIAIFALSLIAVFGVLRIYFPVQFISICTEDGLVENIEFGVYLSTGVLGVWLSMRLRKGRRGRRAVLYLLLGLFCLFCSMEEISWGQRLFGIGTPEVIRKINTQGEITLHNFVPLQAHFASINVAFGAFFSIITALTISPSLRRRFVSDFYALHPVLLLYFLPCLIYGIVRIILGSFEELAASTSPGQALLISRTQEPVELGMAIGLLLMVLLGWSAERTSPTQKTPSRRARSG